VPDPERANFYLLPLLSRSPLSRRVTLRELRALGATEMPFSIYARPISRIEHDEYRSLINLGLITLEFAEEETRRFYITRGALRGKSSSDAAHCASRC
jgi:hypothetical protein